MLRPEVREYLAGPPLRHIRWRDRTSSPPYSPSEWNRLRACREEIIESAWTRQRAAITAGKTGQDPRLAGWEPLNNRLWLVSRQGQLTGPQVADYLDCHPGTVRTRRESLNLPAAAVRVLRRWLEHSALLRRFAVEPDRRQLWLAYVPQNYPGLVTVPQFHSLTMRRWAEVQELRGDDGGPLSIHKHRIRTTFEHRRDKSAWTGRTTIDPNHTARVEGDYYLSQTTPARHDAVNAVIEEAQTDLIRKARTPVVLSSEDVVQAAAGPAPRTRRAPALASPPAAWAKRSTPSRILRATASCSPPTASRRASCPGNQDRRTGDGLHVTRREHHPLGDVMRLDLRPRLTHAIPPFMVDHIRSPGQHRPLAPPPLRYAGTSQLLRASPPARPTSILCLSRISPVEVLPLTALVQRLYQDAPSHVPYESLVRAHAAYIPETTWAVNGCPPGSSRDILATSVSISSNLHFDTSTAEGVRPSLIFPDPT
jgi:hypothetical protein